MRGLSAPRGRKGLLNLCRAPPVGTALPIRWIPLSCWALGCVLARTAEPVWQSWTCGSGVNAGPARVSAWLTGHRPLPGETHNYVALVTGWTADEWASSSPPEKADTTIPQGVPCTRLANLILAPKQERQRIAAYVPHWGIQLAAHLSESTAWAIYRERAARQRIKTEKEIKGHRSRNLGDPSFFTLY